MEDRLMRLRPLAPRPELRSRILAAAGREMAAPSVLDRLWRSRAFWSSAAAAVILGLALGRTPSAAGASAIPAKPSAEAVETAQSIAAMLGDGHALASRIVRELSAPATPTSTPQDAKTLLEDLSCQG